MVMEDYGMHVITKNNKTYVVMHSLEMVMVSDSTDVNQLEGLVPEADDIEFIGTGTGTLMGRTLPYEAYRSSSDPYSETRIFADGARLAGIQQIEGGTVMMSIEIIELSRNIPPGMFDIPTDYQVIEG